ncbi:MAG: histidine kinase [Chloroflexi bacterium]|nr:histidine kinase [Chloroflexota bacterium]
MTKRTVLVATLGGQPQIVTFALQRLHEHGVPITEVAVLHLSRPRYLRALRRLGQAFPGDEFLGRRCHLRPVPIRVDDEPLPDIRGEEDVNAVWRAIYQVIRQLKDDGAQIHLLLTGGRRMMALLGVSAAMLQLEPGDQIWHLYTPDALLKKARDGAILIAPPNSGVRLLRTPIAPLGAYFPAIQVLTRTPDEVLARSTRWLDEQQQALCEKVWAALSPRERDVLRVFAEGKNRREAAAALHLSIKTIDAHKSKILGECRVAWDVDEGKRIDYHFLREKFQDYVRQLR